MLRCIRVFTLFTFLFVGLGLASAQSPAAGAPPTPATPSQQSRLVVFEAFMRQGCGRSQSAGVVIDGLAPEYTGEPVIFIEHDVDATEGHFAARRQRWWDAYQIGGSVSLPLVMVDSGHQFSNGVEEASVYRSMVDAALARPPQAEIEAFWSRVGDRVNFTLEVTNLSDVTLSSANRATVWALVYEDKHVVNTDRYVRAITSTAISTLDPGGVASYTLQTANLTGVDWSKLHYVALVDYRPDPSQRPYDTLQAVIAKPAFSVHPDALTLMADPADALPPTAPVSLPAAGTLDWTSEINAPWLTLTPISGSTAIQPVVSVVTSSLAAGWQQGVITFTSTSGEPISDTLTVHAFYGTVHQLYVPCVLR
jgi:hypothetical protein